MEDRWMYILARMALLERAMTWLDQSPLTPPVWPVQVDSSSATKQAQGVAATERLVAPVVRNQWVHNLSQMEQTTHQQANRHQQLSAVNQQTTKQVSQPTVATHNNWIGGAVHQQVSQPVETQQTQQFWAKTVYPMSSQTVTPPAKLSQQTQSIPQVKETVVTVSPTVYLQATVREQADLDALVTRLNRLLEEEIAISAERAYT